MARPSSDDRPLKSKIALGTMCLFLSLAACGSDGGGGGPGSSLAPLLPERTGWKRVATIASPVPLQADHDAFAVSAYDLQVEGGALRVLYSIDTLIPPAQQTSSPFQSSYFKGSAVEGSADAPVTTATQIADIVPNEHIAEKIIRPMFRPGGDTLETLLFYYNSNEAFFHVQLFDEALRQITQTTFGFNGSHVAKTLANGDILAGDVNLSIIGELQHYRRATNAWTSIDQSAGDGQVLIAYTPFELDDGVDLAFRLYAKDDKAFLSIADFAPGVQFPQAPYTARLTEEHPEYARAGVNGTAPVFAAATTVGAYVTTGKNLTTVLVSKDNASRAYTISAYTWTAGATTFTKLYGGVSISTGLGDLMTKLRDRVACHADGTVYALVNDNNGYRLALAGASGEKSVGVVTAADAPGYTPVLSRLRFVDGAYYAAVGLLLVSRTYQGPELEIVKLVP